jgi:23S rRNA pseudouridine2605 synthase
VSEAPAGVRLQRLLADAGLASRRGSEELIAAGRVEVDGQVVTRLGTRVDPARAVIRVDGTRLPPRTERAYLALNKPVGVVSTMRDPQGRPDLAGVLGRRAERLYHVGRLDADTEGLLLLTNDGDFAQRVAHPSFAVPKTYVAEVAGSVPARVGRKLRAGVELKDGPVAVDRFRVITTAGGRSIVEVVLHEGRNRVVRRLLAQVGHPVQRLTRTAVGPVTLGRLPVGELRDLTHTELGALLDAAGL